MLISFLISRYSSSSSKRLAGGPSRRLVQAGFTLIELIVVSAIILILTSFILFQQGKFNSATLLRSLSYSMALTVRQAQVYGTSVRGFSVGASTAVTFGSGYGVYFPTAGVSPYQYYLFADSPGGDGQRSSGGSEDASPPSPFTLGKGYTVSRLCVRVGQNTPDCTVTSLTVFFRRPNPEACISSSAAPGACVEGAAPIYSSAYVEVKSSGNGDTRSIKIVDTGQIAICKPNITNLALC